jgi:hypothetical protein
MLEEWKFPDVLVQLVRAQVEPALLGEDSCSALLLHLAIRLKHFVYDPSEDSERARLDLAVLNAGINDKRLPSIIDNARQMFDILHNA